MKRGRKRGKRIRPGGRGAGAAFGSLDQILEEIDSRKAWGPRSGVGTTPPRSVLEEEVAKEFRDLLKLKQIGVHDDFFEVGGHSLLATQLVARLRRAYDVNLPLRVVFETPTVAGLALALIEAVATEVGEETVREILDAIRVSPGQ